MKLDMQALTNAVTTSIKPIVDMSNQSGLGNILFHFDEDKVSLRYSDGKNGIEVKLPAEFDEDDVKTDLVVNYKELSDALLLCISGALRVDECVITFNKEKHTLKISCIKSYEYTNGEETILKPISKFEQEMGWAEPESSMKYKLLLRMDYGQLFNCDGDTWNKEEIKNILSKLAIEKTKPVSISAQNNIAFVNTYQFSSVIPLEDVNTGLIITYKSAKALITVLSKIDKEEINISKTDDGNFITITDGETIGVQFEMGSVSKMDVTTVTNYSSKEYTSYQLKFIREAFVNIINALAQTDKMDKHTLKFRENADGDIEMVIQSKSNEYSLVVSGKIANREEVLALEMTIGIKTIKDMLALCNEPYISMFMSAEPEDNGDNKIILRIGDIDMSKTTSNEDITHKIINYTIC
jgi:hypothetical protein